MKKTQQRSLLPAAMLVGVMLAPALASATNGYFSNGYGVKAQGLAGTGIALPQDGLAAATNPAGTAFVDDRIDLGLSLFQPKRSADLVGNGAGADAHYSGDGKRDFYIPEIGYVRRLSSAFSAGVAVYGNGGMNTKYPDNPYARFGATGTAGVDLEQLLITPSVAYKPTESQSFGVGLNIAYQRFSAQGIDVFGGFSSVPGSVSDRGTDSSTGVGVRLGWTGKIAPNLTLGATWASKIHGQFDKYRGLFADGGRFDIPENYGAGVAFRAAPAWTLAADAQRILYSRVAAVGDSISSLFSGRPLGSSDGPGFGWHDITVLKLGVSYVPSNDLTLRAGYSHSDQPIPASETFFNILAPGAVQDHVSIGATWRLAGGELSGFYAHAFRKTVNGSGSIPPTFGGGNADIRLEENIVGISYGWKL